MYPPPPSDDGGSKKALWIILGSLVAVLIVVGVLVVTLLADDDEDADDKRESAAQKDPVSVVNAVIAAAEADDCSGAEEYLTDTLEAANVCDGEEWHLIAAGGVAADVGEAAIDGDRAEVPVDFTSADGTSAYVFDTVRDEDGEWEVAGFRAATDDPSEPTDPTEPTDGLTDDSPTPTSEPTDGTTDSAPQDFPAGSPEATVAAFLAASGENDCATAESYVTQHFLDENGRCESDGEAPEVFDSHVGEATIVGDTATVTMSIMVGSRSADAEATLTKIDGEWKIDDLDT